MLYERLKKLYNLSEYPYSKREFNTFFELGRGNWSSPKGVKDMRPDLDEDTKEAFIREFKPESIEAGIQYLYYFIEVYIKHENARELDELANSRAEAIIKTMMSFGYPPEVTFSVGARESNLLKPGLRAYHLDTTLITREINIKNKLRAMANQDATYLDNQILEEYVKAHSIQPYLTSLQGDYLEVEALRLARIAQIMVGIPQFTLN